MLDYLNKLKTFDENQDTIIKKRILCIIEGDTELRYLVKIFQLHGYSNTTDNKDCYQLTEELIKVSWGNKFPPLYNIVNKNCNFQGGSHKNAKVPYPAVQAFETFKEELNIFDSIIILFDGDEDKNNEIKDYFFEALKDLTITNTLISSDPCFESTLIDFCRCKECRAKINKIDNTTPICEKYKNNFINLDCFTNDKTANGFIANLDNNSLRELNKIESKLNNINITIENYMSKII